MGRRGQNERPKRLNTLSGLRRQIDHTAHLLKNRYRLDGGLNTSTVCCESDG
jgi:hypothetical protein